MMAASGRSVVPFVIVGLVVSLVIGMLVANFAASTPDAQQRAVIESACQNAPDAEACLAEQEGNPVLGIQPAFLADYDVTWASGLVGVAATFAIGVGVALISRRLGSSGASNRVK
ncbi:MAG: PDGLE domain-containing protein [Actinomycetota bacterium]|jgi:hypothetical protein|nr:PDGLE domain-containing protein [Rubrobacter sp.]MDQ3509956.1 PDGLE domain-containing protein [Actinomycetota bacterium]